SLTNVGVTGFANYYARFDFFPSDINGGGVMNQFRVNGNHAGNWNMYATAVENGGAHLRIRGNNLNQFGDFQIGEEITTNCGPAGNTPIGGSPVVHCINTIGNN